MNYGVRYMEGGGQWTERRERFILNLKLKDRKRRGKKEPVGDHYNHIIRRFCTKYGIKYSP